MPGSESLKGEVGRVVLEQHKGKDRPHSFWVMVAGSFWLPLTILVTPYLNFLHHNSYKLGYLEILIVLAGMTLLAFLCSIIIVVGGRVWSGVIIAGLITIFIDFQFDLLEGGYRIACSFMGILGLFWLLGKNCTTIASAVFSTFFVVTLAQSVSFDGTNNVRFAGKMSEGPTDSPPRLIHLVLDEHIGIEGIPTNISEGEEEKEKLKGFYQRNGFHLFGGALSHYYNTDESISNLVNFSAEEERSVVLNKNHLKRNLYFKLLSEYGYRINVLGSGHVDFCQDATIVIDNCFNFHSVSYFGLRHIDAPIIDKLKATLFQYLGTSYAYRKIRMSYQSFSTIFEWGGLTLPSWTWDRQAKLHSLNTFLILDGVWEDVLALPPGNMLFAHLLLPHNPYILEQDCSVKHPILKWKKRTLRRPQGGNTALSREERYRLYIHQLECLYLRLEELFERMQLADIYDDSIIILQGDHGSRIVINEPSYEDQGLLTEQDLSDGFSTLFAVKLPKTQGRYDSSALSLEELLAWVLLKGLGLSVALGYERGEPFVYLASRDKGLVRIPYPISH